MIYLWSFSRIDLWASSKNGPRKNLSDFWQYFWPTWPKWLSWQHWSKQCCLVMTCQGMPWAQQRCTLLSFALHCTAWERARQHAVGTLIVYRVFCSFPFPVQSRQISAMHTYSQFFFLKSQHSINRFSSFFFFFYLERNLLKQLFAPPRHQKYIYYFGLYFSF